MTTGKAEAAIAVSAVVVFSTVTGSQVAGGNIPSGRQVAATFIGFAALSIVAGFAPDLGAGLAIATAGTAFAVYGIPLADKFGFDPYGKKRK